MASQEQEDWRETRTAQMPQDQLGREEGTELQDRMEALDVLDQLVLWAAWATEGQLEHQETLEIPATGATLEPREQLGSMDWMASQGWLVYQDSMETRERRERLVILAVGTEELTGHRGREEVQASVEREEAQEGGDQQGETSTAT